MDLILWRHADAEDGADDMARRLTPRGEKQAAAMAEWLRARLPRNYTVLASPAVRAQQTAAANLPSAWPLDQAAGAPARWYGRACTKYPASAAARPANATDPAASAATTAG